VKKTIHTLDESMFSMFQSKCKNVPRSLRMYTTNVFSLSYLKKNLHRRCILHYSHPNLLFYLDQYRLVLSIIFYDATKIHEKLSRNPKDFSALYIIYYVQIQSISNTFVSTVSKKTKGRAVCRMSTRLTTVQKT